MPRLTIQEQGALIPRPKLHGTEIEPGVVVFNMARTAIKATKPAEIAPELPTEPLEYEPPTYKTQSIKSKIKDWMADNYWRGVDRELGLTDTDDSIVLARQEKRLAERILVAKIAAGVEKPPVWTKNRKALAVAKRAIEA